MPLSPAPGGRGPSGTQPMKSRQDQIAKIETRIAALKKEIRELEAERELLVKQIPSPEGSGAGGR